MNRFWILILLCEIHLCFAQAQNKNKIQAPFDSALHFILNPRGFQNQDFDLTVNYRGVMPSMIPAVTTILRKPQLADSVINALRQDFTILTSNRIHSSDSMWRWLGVRNIQKRKISVSGLVQQIDSNLKAYVKPLSTSEMLFLKKAMPPLFLHHEADTALNPIEAELVSLREAVITDSVMRLSAKMKMHLLANASIALDGLLDTLLGLLNQGEITVKKLKQWGGNIPLKIGGLGNDAHALSQGIVIDRGGDDHYEFPKDPKPGTWLLVVDLHGNDVYHAEDSTGGASGFLSAQIVADLKGDDRYLGDDFAWGSALMGYSHLIEAGGNDLYQARCASLGFAFQGLGRLNDYQGNDVYSAYYLSQGVAGPFGLGALHDQSGNDQYVSRPAFVDDLRYADHFLSLSQGFSTGFSPKYAGGIGMLWDEQGEDLFVADIFGQGSGYWFSWGLLMDDKGNDRFLAHQYAQGAGVHFALGTLLDGVGDDIRISKGVSQGCGHDGGFGWLIDEQGNDKTLGVDKSVGVGSANGFGLYLDFSGHDVYEIGNAAMSLGYADIRRDRGSLGVFLDLGGKDRYPMGIQNDSAWNIYDGKTKGNGLGRDH